MVAKPSGHKNKHTWVELLSSPAKPKPNGINGSKEMNLKNEVGNTDEEDSVKLQELGKNSNGNPHKRPVLATKQLILEAILSSQLVVIPRL